MKYIMEKKLLLVLLSAFFIHVKPEVEVDSNGYILYCPCMGRFGNQAEQFLGSLAFAKGLNRTLVLPAWITYPASRPFFSLQIPFSQWFQVAPLQQFYEKVITMEYFMEKLAPTVWPVGQRKGFCYKFRDGKTECSMKDGNPFGLFWDHYHVNFDESVDHYGILWHIEHKPTLEGWLERFPANKYPVLAFQGAPGNFPSLEQHQIIHKHLEFSDHVIMKANDYIKNNIGGKKYLAIHLRNGIDMTSACDKLDRYQTLFASHQCTRHTKDNKLTLPMCHPSKQEIVKKVKKYLKQSKAEALFIATDNDAMLDTFKKELKEMKVSIHQLLETDDVEGPIIDIALLSKSDFFIGNCVSTFSAFVRRHRETRNLPLAFFGIDDYQNNSKHTEL